MKKYINRSKIQAAIEYEDGEIQYLRRGQTLETDKTVKSIRGEVEVVEVVESKKTAKK
jgi:hypothetical protein